MADSYLPYSAKISSSFFSPRDFLGGGWLSQRTIRQERDLANRSAKSHVIGNISPHDSPAKGGAEHGQATGQCGDRAQPNIEPPGRR
jgi:hypothetical protein